MNCSSAPTSVQACTIKKPTLPGRQRISVNGVVITHAAIARETQNHPASKPAEAWLAAARALVVREMLLHEARCSAIEPRPLTDKDGRLETAEEAMVRQLIEREVVTPTADETQCRRYFHNNRRRFRTPDLHEARHILIAAAPGDPGQRKSAREKANGLVATLTLLPALFADLAATHSACPSAEVGGNLGQIGPGQTVPEFEEALMAMRVGANAPYLVELRYGWHIVILDRRIEGRDLPYEMVRQRIARWLEEKVRRTAICQYVTVLAGRSAIDGVDMGVTVKSTSATSLVQ